MKSTNITDRRPVQGSSGEVISRNRTMNIPKQIDATTEPTSLPAIGLNGKYLKYHILGWLVQNAPQLGKGMLKGDANLESETELTYLRSRQLVQCALIITYAQMVVVDIDQ